MRHRLVVAAVLAALLAVVSPGVAWAHGEGDSDRSYDLVRQAIALIVNTPDDMDTITDKIDDAVQAPDQSDVQIPLVAQAKDAMEASDLNKVRSLLEVSIGARAATDASDPVPMGRPARPVGADTATLVPTDALAGRGALTGGEWVMLGISILAGAAGAVVSLRLRPRHLPHPGPDREAIEETEARSS